MNRNQWIDAVLVLVFFIGMLIVMLTIFDAWSGIFP